jgi:hypothetical protein
MRFPLLYLGAIAAAELVTALVNPIGGIIFHVVLLVLLVYHSSLVSQYACHHMPATTSFILPCLWHL